jgi:hypothetical protein
MTEDTRVYIIRIVLFGGALLIFVLYGLFVL